MAKPPVPPESNQKAVHRQDSSVSEILSEATAVGKSIITGGMSYFSKLFSDHPDTSPSSSRSSPNEEYRRPSSVSPTRNSKSNTRPPRQSEVVQDLSRTDQDLLGDYEMQLALALSMSEQEETERRMRSNSSNN
jgi:hypothetical protein